MNFLRGKKKGSSKRESESGPPTAEKQVEPEPPKPSPPAETEPTQPTHTVSEVTVGETDNEISADSELTKYVCVCSTGTSYKSEPTFSSSSLGLVRNLARVQPLNMLDDTGSSTNQQDKYAWMEVEFEGERLFLPIYTAEGDTLFEADDNKNNGTIKQEDDDRDDDSASISSDESASSASDDEEKPDIPKGEDLGLSGDELAGYNFLAKMGFHSFYSKFRDAKCGTYTEMIDPSNTTDALLSAGVGFSSIQIQVFRLEAMNHHGRNGKEGEDDGDEGEKEEDEEKQESDEEEGGDEEVRVVRERRKTSALLDFAALVSAESAKTTQESVGKSKWRILRKRLTEAKDKLIATSVAERAEMRRATKQADDLSKMFQAINFSMPRDPPPNPSPIRIRSLSISEADLLSRPRFVTSDIKARNVALERAQMRSIAIKPSKLTASVKVPASDVGGFVWTDGGFLIHIHKGSYVQKSGRIATGWRLCSINDVAIPSNATYTLVKARLNAVKETKKNYTLTFEPPVKDGAKKLADLGTPL